MRFRRARPGTVTDQATAWQRLLGAGVVLVILAMQFLDSRHGVTGGPWVVSAQLVLCALATVVAVPSAWRRRSEITPAVWWLVGAFTLIQAWSLVSALVSPASVIRQGTIPRVYQVMPVVTGWLTMTAAVTVLVAMGSAVRRWSLAWAGVALLVGTLLDWPVQAVIHRSPRVASGMGGSAVLHVALILSAAVLADRALGASGRSRYWWWTGAAVGLVLSLLTGSRGALIVAAVLVLMCLLTWGRRTARRVVLIVIIAAGAALAVAISVVHSLHRLATWRSPLRASTYQVAWQAVTESPGRLLLGVGSGSLFPWYAIEAKLYPAPGDRQVVTQYGRVLTSAHSSYVAVGSELGLVMLAVLVALVGMLWQRAVRTIREPGGTVAPVQTLALAAVTVAWLFDSYLVKNFSVSLWWWLVAVSTGLADADSRDRGEPARS
ncbi:Lipid A core - O-antigen ligase and related enzymes [Acidipropionibacterium jensenii]|uniref:Lipid A core - O-antigen ligase and related enzymes n=1 Tax=Acidipropionibacterium jensenii TaxID=1749 RepID=A0A3S4YNZ4_9ACTN|nr:O-antigen ligase family protein [Acidipropionibacterium jensenii]VEI03120.1 Lipid A core - O-antigen ligase and related enzymes [Acidipropionibacterium jensenii]